MRLTSRTLKLIYFALCLVVFTIVTLFILRGKNPEPVDQALPESLQATFMMPDKYVYRQDDAAWAADTIGDTTDTLHAYGCTIASVAMATSNLTSKRITPQSLNAKLSEVGGFTDRGWLIWDKVKEATDSKISATYFDKPNHQDINQCMDEGGYPVIKIKLHESIIHWVKIVGKSNDEYLIRDPLVGTKTDPPIGLSSRSDKIHAVRCIKRAN